MRLVNYLVERCGWAVAEVAPACQRRPARVLACERADPKLVAGHAKTHDDALRNRRKVGVVAELFAGVNVGDVHLDRWAERSRDRVREGERSVRVRSGIEHNAHRAAFRDRGPGFVDPVDEFALVVALPEIQSQPVLGGSGPTQVFDVAEGRGPVGFRIAGTQKVEVGAVENVDGTWRFGGQGSARFTLLVWAEVGLVGYMQGRLAVDRFARLPVGFFAPEFDARLGPGLARDAWHRHAGGRGFEGVFNGFCSR